ncbi:MAG: MarR family transcriptional regulator [Dehalococcoidia bacterium]|nr:MarR family transcriptional regulator [Dehalococcoidia bacterium]
MDKSKLIEEIVQLQHLLARAIRQYAPDAWMELNLTIGQLKSLFFIDFEGTTNVKKLATALGATPPNVTGIVDRLVEQGLVSREGNPDDRRMFILSITDKGKALLAKLREMEISRMSAILMRLSSEELSALAQSLSILIRAAESSKENYRDEHNRS